MTYATYADAWRPTTNVHAWGYDVVAVMGGSVFLALSAQVAMPLPFSPVPLTGQTLGVLLLGLVLGHRRGAASVLTYLLEGSVGLPVFAGGAGGLPVLLGPTGGYLIGFVAAAYLTGLLAERGWDRGRATTLLAMLVGNGVIYVCGLPWLSIFVGADKVIALGLLPFLFGDLVKAGVAMALVPVGWRLLERR